MKLRHLFVVLSFASLIACGKTGTYKKNQEKLLDGKVLQVDPQGAMAGYVRTYQNEEQALLARDTTLLHESLKEKGEIVPIHEYKRGNFREAAKVLETLHDNKIDVFVTGYEIVFGIEPDSSIYIKKSDEEEAKKLLGIK